jgi:four helix bundle protein
MIASHKDLIVWQKSILLVTEVYKLTAKFPKDEVFSLVTQLRRAAVSIPSNIAEGRSRSSREDFRRMLYIAYGSANELDTQLIIAINLGYVSAGEEDPVYGLLREVCKMLNKMISGLSKT